MLGNHNWPSCDICGRTVHRSTGRLLRDEDVDVYWEKCFQVQEQLYQLNKKQEQSGLGEPQLSEIPTDPGAVQWHWGHTRCLPSGEHAIRARRFNTIEDVLYWTLRHTEDDFFPETNWRETVRRFRESEVRTKLRICERPTASAYSNKRPAISARSTFRTWPFGKSNGPAPARPSSGTPGAHLQPRLQLWKGVLHPLQLLVGRQAHLRSKKSAIAPKHKLSIVALVPPDLTPVHFGTAAIVHLDVSGQTLLFGQAAPERLCPPGAPCQRPGATPTAADGPNVPCLARSSRFPLKLLTLKLRWTLLLESLDALPCILCTPKGPT